MVFGILAGGSASGGGGSGSIFGGGGSAPSAPGGTTFGGGGGSPVPIAPPVIVPPVVTPPGVVNPVVPPPRPPVTTPAPVTGFGGASTKALPVITGVTNQDNSWGPVPVVYGDGYQFFPPLASRTYTYQDGAGSNILAIFCLGPGELSLSNISIGGVPVTPANFPTVTTQIKYGNSSDVPFTNHTDNVSPTFVNLPLLFNSAQVVTAPGNADHLGVDITFNHGLYGTVVYGGVPSHQTVVYSNYSVQIKIEYRETGTTGAWTAVTQTYTNKTPLTYRVNWKVATNAKKTYDIRLTRLTIDSAGGVTNDCVWSNVYAWQSIDAFPALSDRKGNRTYMSAISLSAVATDTLNGTLSNLSVIAARLLRSWNVGLGSYNSPAVSANPADIYLDMLNGPSCFEQVPDSQIDLAAIAAWRTYCNTNGYKYQGIVDSSDSAENWMIKVCAAGRAYPMIINGLYSIRVDWPVAAVSQLVTTDNIITGSFLAKAAFGTPLQFVRVTFINTATWTQDVRDVYDDGYTATSPNPTWQALTFAGCCDPNLAYKYGRYQLASTRARPWAYTFQQDIQSLLYQVGNRIKLQHDAIGSGLGCGRINGLVLNGSNDITAISIDAPQLLDGVSTYGLLIQYSADGSIAELPITNTAGTSGTFVLNTPILHSASPLPQIGDMVAFGLFGQEASDLLVTDIQYGPDLTASVTCIDYVAAVYTADTGTVPNFKSVITYNHPTVINLAVPNYINVRSDETVMLRDPDGSYQCRIAVTMEAQPVSIAFFETQISHAGDNTWSASIITTATGGNGTVFVPNVFQNQQYDLRIRVRDSNDNISGWNTSIQGYTVIGKLSPPPDVPNLVSQDGGLIRWFYDLAHGVTIPNDLAGFNIKYAWGDNSNWGNAQFLGMVTTTSFDIRALAFGLKTLMIKAVDTSGNEQAGPAAQIKLNFGTQPINNSLVSYEESTAWTGTIIGATVTGGQLIANDDGSLMWGTDDTTPFWDASDPSLMWNNTCIAMSYEWLLTAGTTIPSPFRILIDESGIVAQSYIIEYRAPDTALFWGATPTTDAEFFFTGPDTDLFWGTDTTVYQLMPTGGIAGGYGSYHFRLSATQSLTTTTISHLAVILDLPNKTESVANIIVSPTGTRVPLVNSYTAIKAVQLTLEQDLVNYPTAATVFFLDRSVAGPLLMVYDSSNNPTSGRVDAKIEGY